MHYKIYYLNNVNIEIPYDLILFRLGYKKNKTLISDDNKKKFLKLIDISEKLCKKKIAYKFCSKINKNNNEVIIDKKLRIKSKNIFDLLKDCNEVVLMSATVGGEIIQKRDYEIKKGDPVFAIILDATASEIADGLLDWLEKYLQINLRRENKFLTKRFSPGYGDLNLDIQYKIYKHLNLKKIGIKITSTNILIPEKSVIAIAGIKNL